MQITSRFVTLAERNRGQKEPEVKKKLESPVPLSSWDPRHEPRWVFYGIRETRQMLFSTLIPFSRWSPCGDCGDRSEVPEYHERWERRRTQSFQGPQVWSSLCSLSLLILTIDWSSKEIFISPFHWNGGLQRWISIMSRDFWPLCEASLPPGQFPGQWDSNPYLLSASSLFSHHTHSFPWADLWI